MLGKEKGSGGMPILHRSVALVPRTQDEQTPVFVRVLRNSVAGLLSFLIVGVILISAMTAVAYANADPDAFIMPLSLAALLPSMFAGGFICAKRTGEAPLLCGIVCGGIVTLVTMLAALILRNTSSSGYELWQECLLHGAAILFEIAQHHRLVFTGEGMFLYLLSKKTMSRIVLCDH